MRGLGVLIVICWASLAAAETVEVRSGEHAGFSRLVFELDTPSDWQLGRTAAGYELRFDRAGLEFVTSRVFEKIPRDRIAAVSAEPGRVLIALGEGCDCHADAFEIRNGKLVVDIKDGPPLHQEFEQRLADGVAAPAPAPSQVQPQRPIASTLGLVEAAPDLAPTPQADTAPRVFRLPPALQDLPQTRQPPRVGPFSAPPAVPETAPALQAPVPEKAPPDGLAKMQAALLEQIGRAAAQGLLEANLPEPVLPVQTDPAHKTSEADQPADTPDLETPDAGAHLRMHAETSLDRDLMALQKAGLPLTEDGDPCLPADWFDVPVWGDAMDPLSGISTHRRAIVGEFDTVHSEEVLALARAYVFAGFGAEASAVLAAFDSAGPEMAILRELAAIMDEGGGEAPAALRDQLACPSAAALWAVLDQPVLPKGDPVEVKAVLSAFAALPPHLRAHLGPELAQKFLEAGDRETAFAVHNATARAQEAPGPDLHLLEARFERDAGDLTAANESLQAIVKEDGPSSAAALVELLDTRIEMGAGADTALLSEAEAVAFEHRATPMEAELRHRIALVHAYAGHYLKAAGQLRQLEREAKIAPDRSDALWSDVLLIAAEQAPPEAFLQLAFSVDDVLGRRNLTYEARGALAERLLSEGFAEKAAAALGGPQKPDDRQRILLARIALESGGARRVATLLAGVSGDEAQALRARAQAAMGHHGFALREYEKTPLMDAAQVAAWRDGNWPWLAESGDTAQGEIARLLLSDDGDVPPPDDTSVFEQNEALLSRSASTRAAVAGILDAYPMVSME